MALQALLRCDASGEIGTGHLLRCEALASELGRRSWECRIIGLPGTSVTARRFSAGDIEVIETEAADDPAAVLALIGGGCDLFVLDSYRLGLEFERSIANAVSQLLVIDDRPVREHCAHALLDPTLGRRANDYEGLVPPAVRMLLGSAYALLRPSFVAARPRALARRHLSANVQRLLLALGGTPKTSILDFLLSGVALSGIDAEIHVISPEPLRREYGRGLRILSHSPTPDIHDLMINCDLAIGAAGGSAWERCCLGLPSLVIQVADNQMDVAASLAAVGAAIDLGAIERLTTDSIPAALCALDRDPAGRAEMARRAALVCDGLGARRVAEAVSPRRAGDGQPVTLRPVAEADARIMIEWQRIPEIRRYAHNPSPPDWKEHVAWLRRRLSDPAAGPFSIIEHSGPAGILRLDTPIPDRLGLGPGQAAQGYLVSILVDPSHRGRGVARAALDAARDLMPDAPLYAEVLEGNDASHALFQSAGYRLLWPGLYAQLGSPGLA